MENAVLVLVAAYWAIWNVNKPTEKTGDWVEAGTLLVKLVMFAAVIWYAREIVAALVYVVSNTWCSIVYPFTQVCK